MSLRKNLKTANIIFLYDGTLNGFFCVVFEAVYSNILPIDIIVEQDAIPSLFDSKKIVTDYNNALRVRKSITERISFRALELIENVYLSCLCQKEIRMLHFLLLGYDEGKKTCSMLGQEDVATLVAAEGRLMGEVHLLKGFVRFSDYDGVLAAVITPKNFVLPYLARHFVERYNTERFVIYDKTHNVALLYENKRPNIVRMDMVELPELSENEEELRSLWRSFYNTISIESRENPRCRMTHMPKRYWENMTEMN